jgi:hypothetical protein
MSDADSVDVGWGATAKAGTTEVPERLWQVNTRGRKVAEMTLAELTTNVKSGKLGARTLVWCDGMPAWTPLGEVRELERLTRADSDPPASGARFIGDEPELVAGTKSYVSLGSEPPTDPGTLAIYERPLATIEFPDAIELLPESVDEPTPAFNPPSLMSARATLPGLAPEDLVPLSSNPLPASPHASPAPPPAPPLPPQPLAGFPSPVTASPLGAALSAMSGSNPSATPLPATRSRPQHDSPNSYAVAKATPIPSLTLNALAAAAAEAAAAARSLTPSTSGSTATNSTATKTPPPAAPSAVSATTKPASPAPTNPLAAKKPFSETLQSSQPPAPTVPPSRGSVTISSKSAPASSIVTVSSTPLPAAGGATSTPKPTVPALANNATSNGSGPPTQQAAVANARSASFVPPRPAIEFLPPIIVQEKEDDGASIITLPLGPKPPLDADFHESTLVLAGRRRPRRWVPLGAAVAASLGSACLASALTALLVNSRPPETRIVEKKVFVPAPATAAPVVSEATPAATTTARAHGEHAATSAPSETEKPTATERAAAKTEASGASTKAWRKDDPGALDQSSSSASHRAGFPTNPGF